MAVSSTTNWDVRSTGNNNNGGGYVPGSSGTDWSVQDSPQYALTGVASSGSGNTVLSSAAANDMVGNIAQVTGGTNFNTGFFQVTSVVVGVSITFSTNNTSQSICSGVGASGVINIGGGFLTIAQANTASVQGNMINIKNATYTLTAGITIPNSDMTYVGYGTTHGDEGTKPLITTSTNSVNIITDVAISVLDTIFDNISMSTTAGTPGNGIEATSRVMKGVTFKNCKLSGFAHGIFGDDGVPFYITGLQLFNTEITGCTSAGVQCQSTNMFGCYIHGNSGDGWVSSGTTYQGGAGSAFISGTIFAANNHGIKLTVTSSTFLFVQNCNFYNNTSDGLDVSGTFDMSILGIVNNIFYLNGGFGLNVESGSASLYPSVNAYNAYGSNTSGARSNSVPAGTGAVSLTANPFTSASTGDFSLNSTAGGGAACTAAGFPGAIGGTTGTAGSMAIGAWQPAAGGGSSGALMVAVGMDGGF